MWLNSVQLFRETKEFLYCHRKIKARQEDVSR